MGLQRRRSVCSFRVQIVLKMDLLFGLFYNLLNTIGLQLLIGRLRRHSRLSRTHDNSLIVP